MNFLKQNMVAIGGLIALVLAGYVYFTYFAGSSSATLSSTDATNTTLSQNLLVTLQNLQTIKLDNSIFSDPAFLSLTNFGVTIPQQAVGNADPFLPLTGAAATGASASASGASSLKIPAGLH